MSDRNSLRKVYNNYEFNGAVLHSLSDYPERYVDVLNFKFVDSLSRT